MAAQVEDARGGRKWILAVALEFADGKYRVEDVNLDEPVDVHTVDEDRVKPLPILNGYPSTDHKGHFAVGDAGNVFSFRNDPCDP